VSDHRAFFSFAVAVLLLGALVTSQQAPPQTRPAGEGRLTSELSLVGRTTSISFVPALRANDPAHASFFAPRAADPPSGKPGRLLIGHFETNGALVFGNVSVGKTGVAAIRYDLWLRAAQNGWDLEITDIAPAAGDTPANPVATISLDRKPNAIPAPTLITSLRPATREAAHLVVKWGDVMATAEMQVTEPQIRRPANNGQPSTPISRKHDDENVGARSLLLSQMNETALVLPTGARFTAVFSRSFTRAQRAVSAAGTAAHLGLTVDGPDFARLMQTADGAVVQLADAAVPRLTNAAPLRFGTTLLHAGNQAPGVPGAYGMWLKRAGRGWRLVFNDESDAWGSQHNPKSDVAEIALTYASAGDPSRPFAVALEPTAADRGRLILLWGPHEWTADFVVGP